MNEAAGTADDWYRFHVRLLVRPTGAQRGAALVLDAGSPAQRRAHPLELTAVQRTLPFPVSFEEVASQLEQLPRLYFEPDGSFVWVGSNEAGRRWQVDGMLYDRAGRLQYVELRGECPAREFKMVLAACGWPVTPLMFELPRHAVCLDEDEFRRWASG